MDGYSSARSPDLRRYDTLVSQTKDSYSTNASSIHAENRQSVGCAPTIHQVGGHITGAIQRDPDIEEIYVHSGQHYDEEMSEQFFKELALPNPHHHLNGGNFSGQEQIELTLSPTKFSILLEEIAPDALIVYGDTNTTLSGALAASHCGIPIAHVEAGLSPATSMPEEYNAQNRPIGQVVLLSHTDICDEPEKEDSSTLHGAR